MSRSSERGFSLVEIMIVLVVVAILSAIALVAVFTAIDTSRQRATMADMRTIAKSIEAYMVDHHMPPVHTGPIETLVPVLKPYYSSVIPTRDHWRHAIRYDGGLAGYTIASYGKDGIDGADLTAAERFDFVRDIILVDGMFVASPE